MKEPGKVISNMLAWVEYMASRGKKVFRIVTRKLPDFSLPSGYAYPLERYYIIGSDDIEGMRTALNGESLAFKKGEIPWPEEGWPFFEMKGTIDGSKVDAVVFGSVSVSEQ